MRQTDGAGAADAGDRLDRLGRWDWVIDTDELRWSGPIFDIFGVRPEEFGGDLGSFMELVHPDDLERLHGEVRRALEEDRPYSVYHRIIRPDGEERIVHERAEVVRDSDGRALRMEGTVQDITEWRRTREAVEILDLAVHSCITPIGMVDSDLRWVYTNDAFVRLLGAGDESELLGRRALPIRLSPEPVYEVVAAVREKGSWSGELTVTRIDGEPIQVQVNGALIRTHDDQELFVVSFIDLSELRRTERELRAREEEMHHILDQVDVVIYRDWFRCGQVDARPGFVSSPIEKLVGRTPDELSRQPELWFDIVHPEDRGALTETVRAARVSGRSAVIEYRVRNQETGRLHWVEESVHPELDDAGRLVGVFGTLRDVTQEREMERERRRLQERVRDVAREWRQTFDAIEVPIFLIRWDGRVRRLNAAAAEISKVGFAGSLDRRLEEIAEGEPWRSAAELVAEVRRTRESMFREVRDPEDGSSWHLTVSPALPDEEERSRWLVAIFRDVTELYRLQETVRRTEKMSAMGALVARVAHEVRNPLFGISATVDALNAEFGGDERLREYLEVLRGELDRMGGVMEDLLDYGRPVSLEVERAALSEVVRQGVDACRPEAETEGVGLRVDLPEDLPALRMDVRQLQQAFRNLTENAIQHSDPGAEVVLRGAVEGGDGDDGPDTVVVTVEDRGPGIGAEDPDRLVEPFYSRRAGGTGLGLWIVQRILAEHQGSLRLRDRPGGGTIAEVRLHSGSAASRGSGETDGGSSG